MNKFKFLTKKEIARLPETAGVYAFKNGKNFLYIGKAGNIKERVKNHLQQSSYRDGFFSSKIKKIGFIKTDSEIEALILESKLIKKYQPKFNIIWRDDKNYFYLAVTREEYPRVFITHQLKTLSCGLKIDYVGPFVDGKSLKKTLKVLRKIFPYRSCKKIPKHPCLWYQLARCPAPCQLKTNLEKRLLNSWRTKIKKECQKNAKNLKKVLTGKRKNLLKELKKEMKKMAKNEKFEKAAEIRDQIFSLNKVLAHAKIFQRFPASFLPLQQWENIEKEIKNIFKIKGGVSRIEAYDVSNIQGKKATGAMIVFVKGVADKNSYRKFKIKSVDKPNDLAMLKEVLERRFNHNEWPFPDLILIDGGKGQLSTALKLKTKNLKLKNIKFLALAKKENKLFIEGRKSPILLKRFPRQIFNLILQLRDEAHRFAKTYHQKLREINQ